uniref:SANT domain-containing protein n=1 Tax=Mesocestoides corti TaxID=53468 RepID=A0A5K3F052_MESCO
MSEVRCFYCLKQFKHLYIRCYDCKCVKLCLFCFSCGVEAGHHKRSHRYCVKYAHAKEDNTCILNHWSDVEELELLDAIEQYGLGNWEDIAENCSNRDAQECYEHYSSFYLHGCFAGVLSQNNCHSNFVTDHTTPILTSCHEKSISLEPIEQQLLGYMVLRDDFERDYDNDAESLLTRLSIRPECDDLEKALHVAHVSIYTQRLQERQKRKEIGRLHGLICRISAYLTNKRPKRRATKVESRSSITPPVFRNKLTPISRVNKRKLPLQSSPASPPAGSWLAAPFALQSSGPTRGIPLVVPGVIPVPREECGRSADLEEYDAFNINEKLKPFLRYFTPTQASQFLSNLHREETLKHEIKYLFTALQKCGSKASSSSRISAPLKEPPEVRSQVYVPAPPNTEPLHPLLIGHPGFGATNTLPPRRSIAAALRSSSTHRAVLKRRRRRRHPSTPWYARLNRHRK